MSNRVVHFEIPSDNPEKAIKFFTEVFAWKFEQFGTIPYWAVTTGDDKNPGINGGLMQKKDKAQPIANSIEVPNIDEHIIKVEKAGGKIVVAKMAIPGVGWLAYFKDTDDNIHGLYQNDPQAK